MSKADSGRLKWDLDSTDDEIWPKVKIGPVWHWRPDVPRPELNATEMLAALPGTSGLIKRPQESALKNDFYTLRDEVEKAVNTFNDIKLGKLDMSSYSAAMECNASQRAFAIGYNQGMRRYFWRPGKGFDRVAQYLPRETVETLNKIDPAVAPSLERAIARLCRRKN